MKPIPEQEIRKVLSELPAEDVEAVVTFVKSIFHMRAAEVSSDIAELSDAEHARIVSALHAVADLSMEQGPAVSNRDHDRYLTNNKHGVANEVTSARGSHGH